jgi:GAF domain-containing protein
LPDFQGKLIMMIDLGADIAAVQSISAVPRILEVVCRSTGMGFAAVARVTEQRWICCAVRDEIAFGLVPGGELELETTICHEIRQSHEAVVIDNVAEDATYCGHHTPAKYGFQSYISTPIMLSDGTFFGTLCAIDPRPARLDTLQTVGMFKLFAELIATHLEAVGRVAASEATLLSERETSELREQFIAVLGHDLRNPLASIEAGTKILAKTDSRDAAGEILGLMQKSVARMSALIDNVLDFARGRLGQGIPLRRLPQSLAPILNQVIAELRASSDNRGRVRSDGAGRLRRRAYRAIVFQSAWQFGDPWHRRDTGPCARDDKERRVRIIGRQFRRTDPVRRDGAAVSAIPSHVRAERPSRPWIGALHRFRNRPRPRRSHRCDIVTTRDLLYVPDAAAVKSGPRWKRHLGARAALDSVRTK